KGAYSAGTSALLAWVIGGIAIIILALIHAELGGMYPVAGGTARFPHFSFGSIAGISFGFFSWVQAVTVAPIEVFAVMQYAAGFHWAFLPGLFNADTSEVTTSGFIWSVILMAIFTALNFFAMRLFNRINAGITWWKVAVPVACIIILFTHFHSANFNSHGGFFPTGAQAMFAAIPSAGIVFAYLGFEQADQLAGEIKNPQRNLPRAIIYAILIATAIYILLQVVFIGALQPSTLSHGWAALQNNKVLEVGPLAAVSTAAGIAWFATILRIDAVISPSGTGLIYQTSGSRIGYGLARNRYFPPPFSWVDKRGIPWFSLIVAFIAGLVFLLPFPSWSALVGLVTSASVLMYAGAPLSLGALRKQVPDADRPYRVPGATVLAPVAFMVASLIIFWSGLLTIWKLGFVLLLGYFLIGIWMVFDKQRPPLDFKAASWLPVYLIGMGILSWQGTYSGGAKKPPLPTGNIPFGWDFLAVSGFALLIYLWAQWARAPREEVLELVARQSSNA
ncbi:MAG: APC family permease, partial [Actinobacteria bacterium]|nr:APC family permease [Actinomycetota bacterium]